MRILYFNEEEHSYSDDLGNGYTSTTTMLGKYKPKFDSKGMARRLARTGKGVYSNRDAKQIEAMWDNSCNMACDKGSVIHDEIEHGVKQVSKFKDAVRYLRNYDPDDRNRLFTFDDVLTLGYIKPLDPEKFYEKVGHKYPIIQQAVEWYIAQGFTLFAELGVYDEKRLISGMIDLLAVNFKTKIVHIIDWKTNKDKISFESYYYKRDEYGQDINEKVIKKRDYLKYPIDDLINCKGYDYGLQLRVYGKLCEQRGFKCEEMNIFHIRDQYILNRYGMPLRDSNNNYVVDEKKERKVEVVHYDMAMIDLLGDAVDRVFADHVKKTQKGGVQYKMF